MKEVAMTRRFLNNSNRIRAYPWLKRQILLVAVLFVPIAAFGQTTTTNTADGTSPLGTAPGSPAGSYALSGFDNVNLYNGNLNFRLPLLHVGGRGTTRAGVMLALNSKHWQIQHVHNPTAPIPQQDTWVPMSKWWVTTPPGYGPGVLYARTSGTPGGSDPSCPTAQLLSAALTRLTFVAPDGTEYDMVDTLTGGQDQSVTNCT